MVHTPLQLLLAAATPFWLAVHKPNCISLARPKGGGNSQWQLKPCRIICSASAHKYSMVLSCHVEGGGGELKLPASICGIVPTSLWGKLELPACAEPCGKWGPSIKPATPPRPLAPLPPSADKTAHFQLPDRQQCNNCARQLAPRCVAGGRWQVAPLRFPFSFSASIAAASIARMLHRGHVACATRGEVGKGHSPQTQLVALGCNKQERERGAGGGNSLDACNLSKVLAAPALSPSPCAPCGKCVCGVWQVWHCF